MQGMHGQVRIPALPVRMCESIKQDSHMLI